MNAFRKSLLATVLMAVGMSSAHAVYTATVTTTGNAFIMLENSGNWMGDNQTLDWQTGLPNGGPGVTFSWDGTYNDNPGTAVQNATLNANGVQFAGAVWVAHDVKIYRGPAAGGAPITYTLLGYSVTVNPGQLAFSMYFDWNGNNNIPVVQVCEPSGYFEAANYFPDYTGTSCVSVDGDGDAISGFGMAAGPFPGKYANFNVNGTTIPTVPTKQSNVPTAAAVAQPTNTSVSVTFSEAMNPATITTSSFTVTTGGGATVCDSISASNPVAANNGTTNKTNILGYLTFACVHAAPLTGSVTYTAAISTTARSVTGIPLAATESWTFGTDVGADVTPPTVSTFTPANLGGTGANNQTVSITFTDAGGGVMDATTAAAMTVTANGGMPVAGGFTTSDNLTFTFTPVGGTLPNSSTIVVTVPAAGSVKDAAGNALAVSPAWSFTTANQTTLAASGLSAAVQGGASKMVSFELVSSATAQSQAIGLGQTPPAGTFTNGFIKFSLNNAGAPGAITTVRLDYNADITGKAIYKYRESTGVYTLLTQGAGANQYEPVAGNANAIDLHIENDGPLDDDAVHAGVIDPLFGPLAAAAVVSASGVSSSSGGGGGCTVDPKGGIDAGLLIALLASLGYAGWRRRSS